MKLESLATCIAIEPFSIDAALHLFLSLINELEALHSAGKYAGDIRLSSVLCDVEGRNVKFATRARAQVVDSLESAQSNDVKALGLVMFSVLNGTLSKEAEESSSCADLYLPLDVPKWLSIIVRRMIRGDQDLAISEIRRLILRNCPAQGVHTNPGFRAENSLGPRPGFVFSSMPAGVKLLPSPERRTEDSVVSIFLPHLTLLLVGILAGVWENEWHVASLGILLPFFLMMSLLGFLPLLILKSTNSELPQAICHWLRGSFYLSIWMLISFLGTLMYIDISGANNNWPNTVEIQSATWVGGAVVSIESVIHGIVLAPAAPGLSMVENLVSGGVSHGSSGKSLVACYALFVFGFICLALYYAELKVTMEYIGSRVWWVAGILGVELLFLFILEDTISLLPASVIFEFLSTEIRLRTMGIFFGIANTVLFWCLIVSAEGEYSLPQRQY